LHDCSQPWSVSQGIVATRQSGNFLYVIDKERSFFVVDLANESHQVVESMNDVPARHRSYFDEMLGRK